MISSMEYEATEPQDESVLVSQTNNFPSFIVDTHSRSHFPANCTAFTVLLINHTQFVMSAKITARTTNLTRSRAKTEPAFSLPVGIALESAGREGKGENVSERKERREERERKKKRDGQIEEEAIFPHVNYTYPNRKT